LKLLVKDAAHLFDVPETTIYRWIKQGSIPAYRLKEQYRFNNAEILEWATARRIPVSPEIFREAGADAASLPRWSEALAAGGDPYRIGGNDTAAILRRIVQVMRLPGEIDREFLYEVLMARKALGLIAIGDGIAIPHVRTPLILDMESPTIALAFLDHPLDLGAFDGRPVHAMFLILSPTVRTHLTLLSRLSFALRDRAFREAVIRPAAPSELMAAAEQCDRYSGPAANAGRDRG
jgi:PTS system nitrogen regulatory IIA component